MTKFTLTVLLAALTSCILRPTASKFIGMPKDSNVLIHRVDRPQWRITYNFTADCPADFRQQEKKLQQLLTKAMQAWIQPLRDHYPQKQFTDDFVFVQQPDTDDCEELDRPWLKQDAGITFSCKGKKRSSFARIDLFVSAPEVCLRGVLDLVNHDRDLINILTHEMGHAFGLHDTYVRAVASTGGLAKTTGKQPSSIMAGTNLFPDTPPFHISTDDKNGIIWLYKHLHEDQPVEDCFFPDYVFEKETRGCRPKHPLIFETKHGTLGTVRQILRDDPTLDLNAHNATGMTALHYAVQRTDIDMVKLLLAQASIKVNIMNQHKQTPAQLARALKQVEIAQLIEAHPSAQQPPHAVDAQGKDPVTWGELKRDTR